MSTQANSSTRPLTPEKMAERLDEVIKKVIELQYVGPGDGQFVTQMELYRRVARAAQGLMVLDDGVYSKFSESPGAILAFIKGYTESRKLQSSTYNEAEGLHRLQSVLKARFGDGT